MDLAALKTLEYEKIRARLQERAGCVLGKELAAALLPSADYEEIEEALAQTAEGCKVLQTAPNVPLGGMRDIRAALRKARLGAALETRELLDFAGALYAMRQIKRFFKEVEIEVPRLRHLAQSIEILGQLENQISAIIDEHGNIRDDASAELLRVRREARQSKGRVKERLDAILRSADNQKYFQDVLVTMRGDRYVIPIKQEYRQFFPGIVHDQSASGATLFIEPMAVVQLNNDIKQLLAAEKHEIERILKVVSGKIADQAEILRENSAVFGRIDFIFAKAKLAQDMDAVLPLMNRDGIVALRQARHPLISREKVVPVDIRLGDSFHALLITGPNTGGKTVSMKTLGLISLMAQSGLFIPALPDSRLAVFQNIFTDIGDEQSIEQSLSTFSAHMTHLVKILDELETDDLLLVDEIGAGTDPEEGAALAMAILEHVMKIGAKVVATTHYSELKAFAYSRAGIENASVEFDVATLRPTYRLLIGIPGSSNAFLISRRLGLAESLILRARQLIDADHAQFEHILNNLEKEKILYEQKNAEIAERERHIASLERKVGAMRQELAEKKEKILAKAREDSNALVRQARRETESIIAELKMQYQDQGAKNRQIAMEKARNSLKDKISQIPVGSKRQAYRQPVRPADLKEGDTVYVTTLDQKATVISAQKKELFVQIGIMKMNVPAKDCMLAESGGEDKKQAGGKPMNFVKVHDVRRQLDIRGMMVGDAEEVVAKYIDDAILAGLGQVLIIHGKGTGALRKGIRAYLKAHRSVQDISIGEINEGGDGATVVQLR